MPPTRTLEVAHEVLDLVRARPATLGAGRLVCLDGPGGSGKTTLAAALVSLRPETRVVHLDDLYDGWTGLDSVHVALAGLLGPLSRDDPGTYRRYDWRARAYAETVVVEPGELLVLEGVGAGHRATAHLAGVLVWVWAPPDLRRARALARDGAEMRAHWDRWMLAEDALHAVDGTADRADVTLVATEPP